MLKQYATKIRGANERERERESRTPQEKMTGSKRIGCLVLTILLLASQSLSFLVPSVYAASSPWNQTDWSGGSGQTSWSDTTKFDSSSNVTTSTTGQVTLTNTEELSNTGFESDLSSWSEVPSYILNDQFTTNRAAGAVNGTSAEPTGGARTVNDTDGDALSISGGTLVSANPNSSWGNPGIWYSAITRAAGLTLVGTIQKSGSAYAGFGFFPSVPYTTQPTTATVGFRLNAGATFPFLANPDGGQVAELDNGTYNMAIVLRTTGAYYYIKGGTYTNWTLLSISSLLSTATLFPGISEYNNAFPTADNIRIPTATWLPQPIASDGFSGSTTDGLGHTEANGGSGFAWTDSVGTWQSSSNIASATALTGGIAVRTLNATAGANSIIDVNLTRSAGVGGLVFRYQDSSNYLIAYHDGTNVKVDKVIGGTPTNVISATGAYGAGRTIRVIMDGTAIRLYYNSALIGTGTITNFATATLHGIYTTDTSNTFDNFVVWPRSGYTTAPFEELTATRDTGTKYAGTASVKLVAGGTDANYLQSKNVGDTNTYDFTTYAFKGAGQAVTTDDVNLYYDGAILSTTFTPVGSDWYKLSGTVAGVASSKDFGVRVKSGKTIYIDNFSLNSYASSGTLTSSIFDSGQGSNWGDLTYSATTPASTSVTVKARTSNDSGMSGATAFASCNAITSGSDISSNNCITDTHRYIQYQFTLANTLTTVSPTFSDISIDFTVSDATAPSISLTALAPDPNTDTTPSLSGTATDAVGTVSAIQFQMDSTSGLWSACTAGDASFDEANETFTCTSTALSDGTHTMYVRSTDSNGNTTGSGSESSDTFTIDATTPISIDLDSPGDNSYTNNERPTFKWKATIDTTAGLSKYVLEIDNPSLGTGQPSGDFIIDNIPTSDTTDVINNRYVIHFDGFSDSDATNNYISIYTRSSSEWSPDSNSGQNDGKLREGIVRWKVKAVDNVGNEVSSSRTLFVDRTNPRVELTQINETPFSTNNYSATDKTPTLYGKIIDSLSGGDTTITQDENGPRVASGPKQVEIKVEKKEGLVYKLHTTYTINMDKSWYTCDNSEVTDNTKQKCDKYLPFEYTPEQNLDFGVYRITVTGKDKADNAVETLLTLNITTLSEIVTPEEEKVIEKTIKDLPQEKQEQVREELEITKPIEPSASANFFNSLIGFVRNLFNSIGNGIQMAFNWVGNEIQLAFNTVGRTIASVFNSIGNGYNSLAQNSPGIIKSSMLAIGNTFSGMMQGVNNAIASTKSGIANLAFTIGVKLEDVSYVAGTAFIKFGYNFVPESTKIYDVQVAVLSSTSAKISWKTNHPANGKINYGLDETYPFDVQTEKRTNDHEFTLTNLTPDTEYHFEVMSQNRNYVYDANRKFATPAK